ncbi:hypothetical protein [Pseudomonas phage vB_PsaM_M1]|nr:hypothetical protein [Pseudomonas phage vB_PsaM_M1]
MKNNNLVITTSNWSSFVASLRSNLKLGYGVCSRTSYRNNYFSAVLQQGTDRAYIARLNSVTGEEKENCVDLVDYLSGVTTVKISDEPLPEKVVQEIKSAIVDYAVQELSKEAVSTTIKRTRQPRKEKK